MLITNDPARVMRLTGFDSWYRCLPPKLGIDSFRSRFPLLVMRDGGLPALVAKEIDRTNLEGIPNPGLELVFHNPYFTFDGLSRPARAHTDVFAAARAVVDGGKAEIDPALPLVLFDPLMEMDGATRAESGRYVVPVHHYIIEAARNTLPGAGSDPDATAAAARIADELGESARVSEWLRREPGDRFDSLNALMEAAGIDAVVAGTPVNVQELTGVPALLVSGEVYAIYLRSSREVHVFSRRELAWFGLPEPGTATAETIRGLLGGARTGVEEEDLTREAFDGLGLSDLATAQASVLLRRWRELRTWVDLEYYLIGANITVKAIDGALALADASAMGDSPATELDVYRRYREVVAAGVDGTNRAVRVRPYFTHTHAGNRSHIPASATDHVLRPLTTLKIDAGLEIYDREGYLRANSDIARSAVGPAAAKDFYATLDRGLTDVLIDACRPGRTGDQLFAAAADWLETHRGSLVAAGFAPPIDATFSQMIGRDVGHLLGKQEPATVVMAKGNDWELHTGMVAAAEFQWPIGDYCFGVEDCFMVTEDEPLNLTRPRR